MRTLGARVPDDVKPDADGLVSPGAGGMSAAPDDPMHLRPHRRPRALGGTGPDPVFAIMVATLPASLTARQDTRTHALVEPTVPVLLAAYTSDLCATRGDWSLFA